LEFFGKPLAGCDTLMAPRSLGQHGAGLFGFLRKAGICSCCFGRQRWAKAMRDFDVAKCERGMRVATPQVVVVEECNALRDMAAHEGE
jgi:hypothetical protein